RSMWLLLAIGALLGTLSVYQEATHNYSAIFGGLARRDIAYIADGLDDRARASGSTGSPLAYGQPLLGLGAVGRWGLVHGRTLGRKLFAGYATAACLAGIGLSFSRGAYLGLVAALVLFALHIRLNPRYLLVILPIVGVLLWVAPAEFKARYT